MQQQGRFIPRDREERDRPQQDNRRRSQFDDQYRAGDRATRPGSRRSDRDGDRYDRYDGVGNWRSQQPDSYRPQYQPKFQPQQPSNRFSNQPRASQQPQNYAAVQPGGYEGRRDVANNAGWRDGGDHRIPESSIAASQSRTANAAAPQVRRNLGRSKHGPPASDTNTVPVPSRKRGHEDEYEDDKTDGNKRPRFEKTQPEKEARAKQAVVEATPRKGAGFVDFFRLGEMMQFESVASEHMVSALRDRPKATQDPESIDAIVGDVMESLKERLQKHQDQDWSDVPVTDISNVLKRRLEAQQDTKSTEQLLEAAAITPVTPGQIDYKFFMSRTTQELQNLSHNLQIWNSIVLGLLFRLHFKDAKYERKRMRDDVTPGSLIWCPIAGPAYDDGIGVEHECRVFTIFGVFIIKMRLCLVIHVRDDEAQVLPGTSFGGSDLSKRHKGEWFRLANLESEADPAVPRPAAGMEVVRYSKANEEWDSLKKPTTMRYTEPIRINARKTPYMKEGRLNHEGFKVFSRLRGLHREHEFCVEDDRLADKDEAIYALKD